MYNSITSNLSSNSNYSTSLKSNAQKARQRKKTLLFICKNKYFSEINANHHEYVDPSHISIPSFIELMAIKGIELPNFLEFLPNKTIVFKDNKFEFIDDIKNSTLMNTNLEIPSFECAAEHVSEDRQNNLINSIQEEIFVPNSLLQEDILNCQLVGPFKIRDLDNFAISSSEDTLAEDLDINNKTVLSTDINWEINKISKHRKKNGKLQFLCHFKPDLINHPYEDYTE
jgi:hypothetical protein